jgi:pimeloyl-ACP methyl ester carboxylesterase
MTTKTATAIDPRRRALAGLPVTDRRLELAGVSTALLDGGEGGPMVLLHGPAGNGSHWGSVIGDLIETHRVLAPDLPGQGASTAPDGEVDSELVLDWLGELIETTCASAPVVVGYGLGGAIAARFAADRPREVAQVVLVDALGLAEFAPRPEFGAALSAFLGEPSPSTHEGLWRHCALDLDSLRERMGDRWDGFEAYNLDRITTPSVQAALGALMQEFGLPAMEAADLGRIAAPTGLIWGRRDAATPLAVAEAASARYGWPLRVIDDCADDPPVERPEAFLDALYATLEGGEVR